MEKSEQAKIKEIIRGICFFYGQNPKISFNESNSLSENAIEINIEVADGSNLIGNEGSNLVALQHLIRVIWRRQNGYHSPRFILDVNNYRKERREYLKSLALETADRVSEENRLVVLRPMNAFERRLIHIALAEDQRVLTESLGEDHERRVIVKPKTN